jgi:hypothetical protein
MNRILNKFQLSRQAVTTLYQPKLVLTAAEKEAKEARAFFESRKMVRRGVIEKAPVLYSSNSMRKLLMNDSTRLESHNQVVFNFKETGNSTDHCLSSKLRFRTYFPLQDASGKDKEESCETIIRQTIKNLNSKQ